MRHGTRKEYFNALVSMVCYALNNRIPPKYTLNVHYSCKRIERKRDISIVFDLYCIQRRQTEGNSGCS